MREFFHHPTGFVGNAVSVVTSELETLFHHKDKKHQYAIYSLSAITYLATVFYTWNEAPKMLDSFNFIIKLLSMVFGGGILGAKNFGFAEGSTEAFFVGAFISFTCIHFLNFTWANRGIIDLYRRFTGIDREHLHFRRVNATRENLFLTTNSAYRTTAPTSADTEEGSASAAGMDAEAARPQPELLVPQHRTRRSDSDISHPRFSLIAGVAGLTIMSAIILAIKVNGNHPALSVIRNRIYHWASVTDASYMGFTMNLASMLLNTKQLLIAKKRTSEQGDTGGTSRVTKAMIIIPTAGMILTGICYAFMNIAGILGFTSSAYIAVPMIATFGVAGTLVNAALYFYSIMKFVNKFINRPPAPDRSALLAPTPPASASTVPARTSCCSTTRAITIYNATRSIIGANILFSGTIDSIFTVTGLSIDELTQRSASNSEIGLIIMAITLGAIMWSARAILSLNAGNNAPLASSGYMTVFSIVTASPYSSNTRRTTLAEVERREHDSEAGLRADTSLT